MDETELTQDDVNDLPGDERDTGWDAGLFLHVGLASRVSLSGTWPRCFASMPSHAGSLQPPTAAR